MQDTVTASLYKENDPYRQTGIFLQWQCWNRRQAEGFEQERLLYAQEREFLWKEGSRTGLGSHYDRMQQRIQADQELQERIIIMKQIFAERLADLREERLLLRELTDPVARYVGYRHLLASYELIRTELQAGHLLFQ